MRPMNLLILMSDQHNKKMTGCYGDPIVQTPNIDGLAARGVRFDAAYTCSPVCVPARAAFATGYYNHQIGFWDNADAYDGSVESWHRVAREAGREAVSIGKLHFRSSDDDYGFSEAQIPMHVIDGTGDLMGLVRDDMPVRGAAWKMEGLAGPGESSYTFYDRTITARAQVWLHDVEKRAAGRPWVLFVSLVCPHYPLTAPPEHYYRYLDDPALPMPRLRDAARRLPHPYLREYARVFNFDDHFDDDEKVRRAVAGYYGLCTFMDEQVGKVLAALDHTGLAGNTRILYTSDHGDNLGARGLWGKSTMYEEVAAVPLILAGPDIAGGRSTGVPASHVDVYQTVLDGLGLASPAAGDGGRGGRHGTSLFALAEAPETDRTVLCEYHGMGSTAGVFMCRDRRYKYVHYVDHPPQLFDLEADPDETRDLGSDPAFAPVRDRLHARLLDFCDPDEVDRRAKARQAALLQAAGGREAVIARGDLGFSPPPGIAAEFD
ncbi:MAG: sulfatase-like hydrolase/transferase [Hyphomicrobiales bacterium]|nr:sulfatase-like hydrolase/transferase [Hyphomicrobiales bacterium]MCP5370978.1 sulfatase-like hydrolase/transferase [Hyphomicrobiales bacterium]